jgi:hypothetical protein
MIGIFIIATGQLYIDYAKSLIKDIEIYFLTKYSKTIYLFTDSKEKIDGVVKLYHKHEPWPSPTLNRYKWILEAVKKNNINHQYWYYIDADMECVDTVGDEILGRSVATRHPGFFHKKPEQFSLETKFLSKAYVNPNKAKFYYCGGFNGGQNYLKMAETIKEWVDIDQKYGHTPKYHDEMYLNRYLIDNPPDVILSPEYCMPETAKEKITYGIMNLHPRIICLTKTTNTHI